MAQSDIGSKKICKILNDEGIATPINHRKWLLYGIAPRSARWSCGTINAILRNQTYLGHTIQGTYDVARFHKTPSKIEPQKDWIIAQNTYEAIVDAETFELVGKLIDTRNRPLKFNTLQLFAGFVKCKDFASALGYAYSQIIEQYTCGTYRRHGRKFCAS